MPIRNSTAVADMGDFVWVTDCEDAIQVHDGRWYVGRVWNDGSVLMSMVWSAKRDRMAVDHDLPGVKPETACVELLKVLHYGPAHDRTVAARLQGTPKNRLGAVECVMRMPVEDTPTVLDRSSEIIVNAALSRLEKGK